MLARATLFVSCPEGAFNANVIFSYTTRGFTTKVGSVTMMQSNDTTWESEMGVIVVQDTLGNRNTTNEVSE